jgi:hypothetical protein
MAGYDAHDDRFPFTREDLVFALSLSPLSPRERGRGEASPYRGLPMSCNPLSGVVLYRG